MGIVAGCLPVFVSILEESVGAGAVVVVGFRSVTSERALAANERKSFFRFYDWLCIFDCGWRRNGMNLFAFKFIHAFAF